MELVSLKVTIGLKTESDKRGQFKRLHAYPDFNSVSEELREGMDWSHFVDQYGGWHYDKVSGHDDDDSQNGSPRGKWIGMLLVPEPFANEAVRLFPDQCQIMDATGAERFYEDRVTVNEPGVIEDLDVLQVIAAKRQAGLREDDSDRAAMDPDNPRRGRRKNDRKKFADMLKKRGLRIKQ